MPYYYIDALDPAGASAFVSLREKGLLWTKPEATEPVWYLSAPDFTSTPVGSRAIGLAATVRGHQIGLSVDGNTEVPFMTLESAAAFVRRLYLAGGGPGGDAGGLIPPPKPEGGEPPELPPLPEMRFEEGILAAMMGRVDVLARYAKPLNSKEGLTAAAVPTEMSFGLSDHSLRAEGAAALEHALELIGAAISERRPAATGTTRAQWLKSVQVFRQLGYALDLQNLLNRKWMQKPRKIRDLRPFFSSDSDPVDPLDLLAQAPLPSAISLGEHWDSVADLFFDCIAAPSKLAAGREGLRRCYLLLFAAYFLTSGGRISVRGLKLSDRSVLFAAEMRRVVVWLLDQMPDHAFAPEIEQIFMEQRRVI